jgi:hypothetical protein
MLVNPREPQRSAALNCELKIQPYGGANRAKRPVLYGQPAGAGVTLRSLLRTSASALWSTWLPFLSALLNSTPKLASPQPTND